MYKIEATIRPERLPEVTAALREIGIDAFTVLEVSRHSVAGRPRACYRGVEYETPLVHQSRVEFCVADDQVLHTVECVRRAAHAGKPGDGIILVQALDGAIDINAPLSEPPIVAASRTMPLPHTRAPLSAALPSAY